MKLKVVILGCVLVAFGFLTALIFPVCFPIEQTYVVGGGELTGLSPNFALLYLGVGVVFLGALLAVVGLMRR